MNTYIFDQGWQKERDRLRGIESLFDSYSTQRLADLGVSDGWHCLEVGFGAGGVALWLAGQVGSTGRVVAVDIDPRFLDGHGRANLEVRKLDILTGPLEEAAFDVAHARAVLEHIPDRQRALERMVSAVRPGGWLVLEAADFGGVMAAALAHYTDPPEQAASYERVGRAVVAAFTAAGGDANYGARLVRAFKDAGLVNIAAEARTHLVADERTPPEAVARLRALLGDYERAAARLDRPDERPGDQSGCSPTGSAPRRRSPRARRRRA